MKIMIVGAGIIGTIYGWAISEAGHEVTHFVRPGKAARLIDGISMDVLDNRKGYKKKYLGRYNLQVTETLNPSDGFELVIVPTKPYQLEEALQSIVPFVDSGDYLLLTQNWHGTAKIDAILPQSHYIYGDAKAGGVFEDGTLVAAIFPSIDLGKVSKETGGPLEKAVALFEDAKIDVVIHENILHYIWVQYAITGGLWPAVVRAAGLDELLRDRRTGELSLLMVNECLEVVARRGVDLKRYPDTRMWTTQSAFRRQVALIGLILLFRFNKSVYRTSAHALGDPIEIKTSYYDLLNTGRELGVDMPVMSSFEDDILRFTNSK